MIDRKFATCTLCEAICGITVETDGDRVTTIRGDAEDPFSQGHVCPKAAALKDLHEDPDRLRRPMRRDGDTWREIEWDEAFDLVALRLRDVQARHGRDAVAVYQGNPTVHSLGAMLYAPSFVRALRTQTRFSATSVDQLPQMLAAHAMFGHQLLLPIPDIDRTDHLLIFGANPVVSNGSLLTAPGVEKRLAAIRERGGRVIVLDPRRTETAEIASEHHFVRPGRDAFVLLAMIHTLFAEDLVRTGRASAFLTGAGDVRLLADRFSPDRVAPVTGLAADTIRKLARDFAKAERAVAYGRVGLCTQELGGLSAWLLNVLNVLTGRLDVPGGAMFTKPALDIVGMNLVGKGHLGYYRSRVRGLPEMGGELPVAVLAEEIETPGDGQIRALVTSSGNPVLSTPNGGRLERALASLDFMVSIDFYLNETTRHAHVILPPTAALERDHYDAVFHALAVRDTSRFSQAVFPKPPGALHDWEIFTALTERLQSHLKGVAGLRARATTAAMKRLGPRGLLDLGLRLGPHGGKLAPWKRGLTLATLLENPHGIDLGALSPRLPGALKTSDRRVHLAPEVFMIDAARLDRLVPDRPRVTVVETGSGRRAALPIVRAEDDTTRAALRTQDSELLLIGRRSLRSNNSWMHNSLRLVKGPDRCTLKMSPADAAARSLTNGDRVKVRSRVGAVEVTLSVSDEMMPGVVSLPHGFGHHRPGTRLSVASQHAGQSVNDLTDDLRIDPLTGTADFVVPVTVTRLP